MIMKFLKRQWLLFWIAQYDESIAELPDADITAQQVFDSIMDAEERMRNERAAMVDKLAALEA
jgi:hypothetical protein